MERPDAEIHGTVCAGKRVLIPAGAAASLVRRPLSMFPEKLFPVLYRAGPGVFLKFLVKIVHILVADALGNLIDL